MFRALLPVAYSGNSPHLIAYSDVDWVGGLIHVAPSLVGVCS